MHIGIRMAFLPPTVWTFFKLMKALVYSIFYTSLKLFFYLLYEIAKGLKVSILYRGCKLDINKRFF